jgi:prevent-host-death family protein
VTASSTEHAVGFSELSDHLGQYMDEVADGGTLLVTLNGRDVARISPVESPPSKNGSGLTDEPLGIGFPVEQLHQIPIEGSIGGFI